MGIRILGEKNINEYKKNTIGGNSIEAQSIVDVDRYNQYVVGDMIDCNKIVGIFVFHECDQAWMVLQYPGGQLFEVDIQYTDGANIRVFWESCINIEDMQSLDINIAHECECVYDCCNNWKHGDIVTMWRIDNNHMNMDDVAIVHMRDIAGNFKWR